jgi:LPS-assembly lipoprotein
MLVVAMTLSGCGFTLRGKTAIPFETIHVEAAGFSAFVNDLERAINSSSQTRVVTNRNEADAVLRIVAEAQEKHILSLSSGGRVREFELRYRVAYRLTTPSGTELTPPADIILRRDMTYDDTEVLAKESEEALLFRDMKSDAVQQVLRRLAAVKPAS